MSRFATVDDRLGVDLPTLEAEWSSSQPLRVASVNAIGADYAVDLASGQPAPLGTGAEQLKAMFVDQDLARLDMTIDIFRATIWRIGVGRLWQTRADGTRRWCLARASAMPDLTLGTADIQQAAISVDFTRLSHWQAETLTIQRIALVAPSQTIWVTPDGTLPVQAISLTFQANGPNGFNAPAIFNQTTGESFASNRVAASDQSLLTIDTGRWLIQYSDDGGLTWTDDSANVEIGLIQVGLLRFEPGTNRLTLTNDTTPNATLTISYANAWL